MKYCPGCKTEKTTESFYKNKSTKDGLQAYCKDCWKMKSGESRVRHIEARRLQARRHRAEIRNAEPERIKLEYQEWYAKSGKNYHRDWQSNNREKVRHAAITWRRRHPEESRSSGNKTRLRRAGLTEFHTLDEWLDLIRKCDGKCLKCGTDENITIDHVIAISQGGSDLISNIQPLCKKCNASKGNKSTDYRPIDHFT